MENYAVTQAMTFTHLEEQLLAELNTQRQDLLEQLLQKRQSVDMTDVLGIRLDCDGIDVRGDEKIWLLNYPAAITVPSLDGLTSIKMVN